jgi:A/G-specific adenine glycosylase
MLQQTRAAAVIRYYERFLARYPTVKALAASDESELLECWSGLGYYSRARNLRRAAQQIAREGFPRTAEAWQSLPGVGPYTAAAVASIAFDEPVAVLDGNVARVVARLVAHRGDVRSPKVREELRAHAQQLLDRRHPGDFNQAMMELGATVCLPRRPQCPLCPLARSCEARRLGLQNELPVRLGRREPVRVDLSVAVVRRGQKLLLVRRPDNVSLMPGFWELPTADGLQLGEPLGSFPHAITHHRYRVTVYAARSPRCLPEAGRWVALRDLAGLPVTTITRKALRLISAASPTSQHCQYRLPICPAPSQRWSRTGDGPERASRDPAARRLPADLPDQSRRSLRSL